MQCLNPKVIPIRSKVISPLFGEKLMMEIPCGICSSCQQRGQREWYYRAYYEYLSTVQKGGYMLMDCLTYDEKFVPRLSRFYPDLPTELDSYCFDYYDLRYFLVSLREYLTRKGYDIKDKLRYFAAAEYGTNKNATHRPHIHILFYCTSPELTNFKLSAAIEKCWHYGHCDGVIYKGRRYTDDMTIKGGLASAQRACKYVSKYVMKDSSYQKIIDERLSKILSYYYEQKFSFYKKGSCVVDLDKDYRQVDRVVCWKDFESFMRSTTAKNLRSRLRRYVNQFHRQSLGFGSYALDYQDIEDIIKCNLVTIADSKSVVMRLALPTYFRRKLFYHLVEVNGMKSWTKNCDAVSRRYFDFRKADKIRLLKEKIVLFNKNFNSSISVDELSDYILNKRFVALDAAYNDIDDMSIVDKLNAPHLYNYSCNSDQHYFRGKFITDTYLGVSATNYVQDKRLTKNITAVPFYDYINLNSYVDEILESYIALMKEKQSSLFDSIQRNFDNKQRLNQIYKSLC